MCVVSRGGKGGDVLWYGEGVHKISKAVNSLRRVSCEIVLLAKPIFGRNPTGVYVLGAVDH